MDENKVLKLKLSIDQWIWENIPGNWTLDKAEELACAVIKKIEEIEGRG